MRELQSAFMDMNLSSSSKSSVAPTPLGSFVPTPLGSLCSVIGFKDADLKALVQQDFDSSWNVHGIQGQKLVHVEGDENCASRALAVHFYHDEACWAQVKEIVTNYAI